MLACYPETKSYEMNPIKLLEADFPNNIAHVVVWDGNIGYWCAMSLRLFMAIEQWEKYKMWTFYPLENIHASTDKH